MLGLPALQSELRDKHTDPLFPSPANIIFFCFGLFQLRLAAPLIAAVDTPFRFLFVGSLPVPLPKVAGTATASTNQSTFWSYRFLRYEAIDVFIWRRRRRGGRCGEAGRRCGGARYKSTVEET
jgi:hypothetical protein